MAKQKSNCSECGMETTSTLIGKDGFICKKCYRGHKTILGFSDRTPIKSLKQALDKTYEIKGYKMRNGGICVMSSFPQILIGRKVKLMVVEE